MGGHAIPSGSAIWSAPSGQPKPKSSIKPPTMPTSCILQCVTGPTSNAPLVISLAQDLLPTDSHTPHFECALKLLNSLVTHVVGHQGQGLKQALDISSSCLAAFMVSLAGGDHQFVSIWSSDQQIGEALVVIGKWIVAALAPLGSTALFTPTSTKPEAPSSSTLAAASNTATMAPTPSTWQASSLPLGSLMLSIHKEAIPASPMDTSSLITLSTSAPEASAPIIQYIFGHYSRGAEPAVACCSWLYW
ncbi:hypothetical protein E4T56_gene609 [Termitomyces sp. T112]|nr:hypothetical protein E4T56_gene609 [Termitomyces sp. T112]